MPKFALAAPSWPTCMAACSSRHWSRVAVMWADYLAPIFFGGRPAVLDWIAKTSDSREGCSTPHLPRRLKEIRRHRKRSSAVDIRGESTHLRPRCP